MRRIYQAIKKMIQAMVLFAMCITIIGMVSAVLADIMIDHRVSEMWEELNVYYDAKYEADKAELEQRYGILSLEDPSWDDPEQQINI